MDGVPPHGVRPSSHHLPIIGGIMHLTRYAPLLLLLLGSTAASAKIPDFGVRTAPDIIKKDPNPKAREFYAELVEHSKKQGRQMVADTKKTTGLKASDLKKVDWDCLFWRVAASVAKHIRSTNPGLQPPEFADAMERTALDDDDCPDEGGPGSNGVKVYNAAINQVQAGRYGLQRESSADEWMARLATILGAGIGVGEAAPAGAPAGMVPILNPKLFLPRDASPTDGT
jgi:hypothetical protein